MNRPCVYIGWDPREADAFAVARHSMRRRMTTPVPIRGLLLSELQRQGFYTRPTTIKVNGEGRPEIVDELSKRPDYDGRMSTQHANARFFVPQIHGPGLALFVDSDILVRGNVSELFWKAYKARSKAAWCVKHDYRPEGTVKMDGQPQAKYARKNWSSVLLFNCDHPSHKKLTLDLLNSAPGSFLHALGWLEDDEIGELDVSWNWLVGHSPADVEPAICHFTTGTPSMPGYENVPYADEWRAELEQWASAA